MKLPTLLAMLLFGAMAPSMDAPAPLRMAVPYEGTYDYEAAIPPEYLEPPENLAAQVPAAPVLTPLPEGQAPVAAGQEAAPAEEAPVQPAAPEVQAAPAPAPPAAAAAIPRVGPLASPDVKALQAQLDAQQHALSATQEQLGVQKSQLEATQQQLGATRQQLEATQEQIPPLQQQAQAGAETSSALVDRGKEIARAAEARAAALSQTSDQLASMLYQLQDGDAGFEDSLERMQDLLSSSSAQASAVGNVQEADATDRAQDFVSQARDQVANSDLFNARVNLGAAWPWVQRAANLAANIPSGPIHGYAPHPDVTPAPAPVYGY